ncbi:hypothetical protein JD844_020487 [Phrynosoma platyrhinos]|uniref:C2 domain-containing protein n=1 Tax=Phrynosoma platyrhinos TaxID=52577 RepID=A0ABQ7SSI9_PHRPL|nr:hypothetical protein JD844_020487 [Phrynosoma platyrhinos]
MASQDVVSFFQPLSSWMSRFYEALQEAGDTISSSFVSMGNRSAHSANEEGDEGLENSNESYEHCSEGSDNESTFSQASEESDLYHDELESSASNLGPYWYEGKRRNLQILEEYPDDDSLDSHGVCQAYKANGLKDAAALQVLAKAHVCVYSFLSVNSYGEDEDLTTSSDSDDEMIKQFEISVSRSQSFRSGVSEKGTQAGLERRPKFNRLLSNHEEYSSEVSECEDLDGFSQLSYQDNLSYHEDDHLSFDSRTASESRGSGQPKNPDMEVSMLPSLSRQETGGSLEMETAFSNQGFEGNDATDSSSAWSPEEHNGANVLPAHPSPHEPISKCGDLDVIFDYRPSSQKLLVTILEAKDIPDKDRSGVSTWQVHLVLMPSKKQRGKSSVQRGPNPAFKDKVTFTKLAPEELNTYAIRFRLYSVRKMIKERMMGERFFHLSNLNQEGEMKMTLVLEPRSNLCLSKTDTYGKLCLLNSVGQEMSRCKTSIRRGQPNPVYRETFVFQVALFQLSDVTLMISIYNRRSIKRKEMIGWLSMGQNSSGEEEQNHWQEMKESKAQQVCRWHTLLES